MCGRARIGNGQVFPGDKVCIVTSGGLIDKTWGRDGYYNARSEKFYTTWKKISDNRCIMIVSEFIEGNGIFVPKDSDTFSLAGIYGNNYFMVLTQDSNEIVKPYHHRMPVIINNYENYYLENSEINFEMFNYNLQVA